MKLNQLLLVRLQGTEHVPGHQLLDVVVGGVSDRQGLSIASDAPLSLRVT